MLCEGLGEPQLRKSYFEGTGICVTIFFAIRKAFLSSSNANESVRLSGVTHIYQYTSTVLPFISSVC